MAPIAREENEGLSERPTSKRYRQYVGVLVATLAAFSIGTYLSWTSSALPLYNRNDTLSVSEQEGSWIACLMPLGAIPVAIPAATMTDKFGPRRTIWATSVPLFLCWYVIGFARNKIWLFLARFVAGMACGAAHIVVPMYISEITERSIGGSLLGAVFQLQLTAGILFAYAIAFTDSLHVIAILCSVAPALLLISLPFVPESPTWLVMRGRKNAANDVLRHFRGSPRCRTETELIRLELRATEMREARPEILDLRRYRKAISIALGLMIFQQFSGVSVLIFYAKKIFDDANSSPGPSASPVVVGAVQVIAACFSPVMIKRAGKKILLFVSASVSAVCMFTLSGYFHFQKSHDLTSVPWVTPLSFATFVATFSVGFGPVPWLMVGELFANNVRSVARTAATICNWTLTFLVTKCFWDMARLVGISSTFAAFGMLNLIGTVFVSALVPETKGRSAEEIRNELYGTRNEIPREPIAGIVTEVRAT